MPFVIEPLPTLLDDIRARYVAGEIDVDDLESGVAELLQTGTADDVAPGYGMPLVREWR